MIESRDLHAIAYRIKQLQLIAVQEQVQLETGLADEFGQDAAKIGYCLLYTSDAADE